MARPIDQWVLVTGANDGGLGEAIVAALLSKGFNVIATSNDQARLHITKPADCTVEGFLVRLGMDTTSVTAIESAVEHVTQITDGKLNYLINNAGCGYYMPLIDARIRDARHQFDVNLWGTLAVTQTFFPMLREARGTVVNHITAAAVSNLNEAFMGVYASSQAALRSLNDTLRLELAPFGIKVIAFVTGPANVQPARRTTEDLRVGLPRHSAYHYLEDEAVGALHSRISTVAAHDWHAVADQLISELLKSPAPPFVVRGYLTLLLWWIGWILPAWLTDWVGSQRRGLNGLRGPPVESAVHEKKKS